MMAVKPASLVLSVLNCISNNSSACSRDIGSNYNFRNINSIYSFRAAVKSKLTMKKILLLVLVAGVLAGCNKDDASHNDSFYFMCKIDGVDKTFSANMFGYKETNGANYGY